MSADPNNVILVGHSFEAQAALRYAKLYAVQGIILVSAVMGGMSSERAVAEVLIVVVVTVISW